MLLSKGQALLFIYERFAKEKRVTKASIQDICQISSITFKRYVGEIRGYYAQVHPDYEIIYDRKKDCYLVQKNQKNNNPFEE